MVIAVFSLLLLFSLFRTITYEVVLIPDEILFLNILAAYASIWVLTLSLMNIEGEGDQ